MLTGKHTGRSVNDKFIVKDGENDEKIDWGKINTPISISNFNKIYESFLNYAQNKILYNPSNIVEHYYTNNGATWKNL